MPAVQHIGAATREPYLVLAVTGIVVTHIGQYPAAPHLLPLSHPVRYNVGRLDLFAHAQYVYVHWVALILSLGRQIKRDK
jgi:hypothetical protein